MANEEMERGTNSPLSTAVSGDTEAPEQQKNQQQKNRFSFYDAKAVGNIAVGSSEPSSSPSTNEKPNPKRFNFYDPVMIAAASENYPSTKRNIQNQLQEIDQEAIAKLPANAATSDPAPSKTRDDDNIQIATDRSQKEDTENKHTDEILRSLQETENQRMQILKPATESLSETAGPAITRGTSRDIDDAVRSNENSITGVDMAASRAASAVVLDDNTNINENDDKSENNSNNPYEDSIRAALTLLRKHRSSPNHLSPVNNNNDEIELGDDFNRNDVKDIRTGMRYHDPNLKDCSDDGGIEDDKNANEKAVDNAVQEAKMKSKQRQERMAKYASRLQELKSSLPPEQQLTPQFSSSYTENYNYDQDNINDKEDSLDRTKASDLEQTQKEEPEEPENIGDDSEQHLPNHIHRHIKPSLTEDSTGIVSELSQYSNNNYQHRSQNSNFQHQQQVIIEEQVQKGVEKILVAILEASKNKSVGGGGDSSSGDASISNTNGLIEIMSTNSRENTNDALLQVLHELLPTSRSIDTGSINSRDAGRGATATVCSKYSVSAVSHESSVNNRSRKSSVVDELLAEVDDEDHATNSKTTLVNEIRPPLSCNSNVDAARQWAELDEKKMTEEIGYSELRHSSETDSTSFILAAINHSKKEKFDSDDADVNVEKGNADNSSVNSLFESNASNKDESVSKSSYSGEEDDDMDTTFEDDDGSFEEDNNGEGHNVGVLGPLSREAGGTTGVVLDVESDSSPSPAQVEGRRGYFSPVVDYVASALSPEDEQRILEDRIRGEFLASYDVVGTTTNIQDDEATELMRTLCAHLLPFGVDQNSSREDSTPVWDGENVNEPGYRIIRLSKSQLRRVERAFDAMITRLKLNSQSSLNGVEGQFDENFMRELEEAERLLDDEEERNIKEKTNGTVSADVTREIQPSLSEEPTDDGEADVCHPEFPGVKGAGKGEMGDLEYFQLPIIFKSHVTGFEPTKDMALEPGNIIAGQYLVESELGSAAFSTAYRCVDLSSEDNDGHEEVCLKVIKNTKDFFDQSLDEIKILELLRQTGKCDENHILRVKTFFYYREHLIIVTELLRQNLFEFGKFIVDNDEEPYFTLPRLAYITRQCLIALRFVHSLGLVHSDVKPENILLGSYSRAQIKLIDFGSSCYLTDRQSSYIQSRSYRAPEVVLGLPYDGKIDVWSLGCVVAEMYTGDVTFQNDSIVSMLSRIEAFRGSFPRHMIAQGRQCGRFFTKCGLLYEVVGQSDEDEGLTITPPAPDDEESDSDGELEQIEFDIFQPKKTQLSSRLGFDDDLMSDYGGKNVKIERQREQMFTDFVARLLTIDPDGRPSAEEALKHPYMLYAASLTDEHIKYPSN